MLPTAALLVPCDDPFRLEEASRELPCGAEVEADCRPELGREVKSSHCQLLNLRGR